jgi:gas vesicle protein
MKDSGLGSFAVGVVIGGLVGAALGLLLAPQTGEELRDQVGGFVDTRRTAFGDAINEGRAAAEKARADMLAEYEAEAAVHTDAREGGAAEEGAAS